jgi:hypothetical protein
VRTGGTPAPRTAGQTILQRLIISVSLSASEEIDPDPDSRSRLPIPTPDPDSRFPTPMPTPMPMPIPSKGEARGKGDKVGQSVSEREDFRNYKGLPSFSQTAVPLSARSASVPGSAIHTSLPILTMKPWRQTAEVRDIDVSCG